MMMRMRFRIWHLLAAMVLVALWAPLSKWLSALEAKDHPQKPQETLDVIAFYIGSTAIILIPLAMAWIIMDARRKRKREREKELERPAPS
jgi:hypothetical protein